MKAFYYIIAAMMALVGCTSEDPIFNDKPHTGKSFKISKEKAVKIANEWIDDICGVSTRSNPRIVSNVEAIIDDNVTRCGDDTTDTLLYIVNFQNEQGFAIVGAHSKAKPVYAVSDNSNFTIDENTPEEIKNFFALAKKNAKESRESHTTMLSDSDIFIPITPDPGTQLPPVKPLISLHQSKIGPTKYYSKYVINRAGEPALTNCVPIAIEIAMSYHKWPNTLEGYDFNWTSMNEGSDDDGIARMLAILSSKKYCNLEHNSDTTLGTADSRWIPFVFRNCGYNIETSWYNSFEHITLNELVNHLQNIGPIIINGKSHYFLTDNGQKNGHLWVLDGYMNKIVPIQTGPYFGWITNHYYHCVWGYNGSCNGYYLSSDECYFDGAPDLLGETDNGDTSCSIYCKFDYDSHDMRYFSNFKPNK